MELAKRDDVPVELTWDLSLIYPTEEAMLADAQKMKELSLSMEASYKGNLTDAATINHCLDDYQEVYRLITLTASSPFLSTITTVQTRRATTASTA